MLGQGQRRSGEAEGKCYGQEAEKCADLLVRVAACASSLAYAADHLAVPEKVAGEALEALAAQLDAKQQKGECP